MRTGAPGRGHWPVLSCFNIIEKLDRRNKVTEVLDLKHCDWEKWPNALDKEVESNNELQNATTTSELWKELLKSITTTKDQYIPRKSVSNHSKPFWNQELSILSRLLRNAQKDFRRNSNLRNRQIMDLYQEEFSNKLAKAIDDWTTTNAEKLNTKDKQKFWDCYKKILSH